MTTGKKKFTTAPEYYQSIPAAAKTVLQQIRELILRTAPRTEEHIQAAKKKTKK